MTAPRRNPLPISQVDKAKRYASALAKDVEAIFASGWREVSRRVAEGLTLFPLDWTTKQTEALISARFPLMVRISGESARDAKAELQRRKSAEAVALMRKESLEIAFDLPPFNVSVRHWLEQVAKATTARNAARIERVHARARAWRDPEFGSGKTPADIAKDLLREGLADSKNHARMIAVTDVAWAANHGAREQYAMMGVTVYQWKTAADDAVCPFCSAMDGAIVQGSDPFWPAGSTQGVVTNEDGERVPGKLEPNESEGERQRVLDHPYDVSAPPLHPNCACTIIPVLEPVTRLS